MYQDTCCSGNSEPLKFRYMQLHKEKNKSNREKVCAMLSKQEIKELIILQRCVG